MKIECIVTDDEPLARRELIGYIGRTDSLSLIGECEDAIALGEMLKSTTPQILFLDIEMPYLNGLDFLSSLQSSPKVIITSAYDQYAFRGYELDVVDYLLKPISYDRFSRAIEKVLPLIHTPEYIFIKADRKLIKVECDDILFIEGLGNYVIVYTDNGKITTLATLRSIIELLPDRSFMQVHRSYIVNISKIDSIDGYTLEVRAHRIPISRNLRDRIVSCVVGKYII
ncbi:MAG: LytTR family DNA-binding domain-containing protein [Duncaniella sp.]|nr:LytTR family DNA-binding domain-containing protein [Duncaniella sp.]MDE6466664.1 LytTR family DNA-binding domain-containing protein [Duncaniella sp.]